MRRHPSARPTRPFPVRLMVGITVALVGGLIGSAGLVAPANAAPATTGSSSTTAGAGLDTPAVGATGIDVKFEVRSDQPGDPTATGYPPMKIDVYADGRVKVEKGGQCLDTWAMDGFKPWRELGIFVDCMENPSQAYYFVPAAHQPTAAANSDVDEHWFYIVSQSGKKCLTSPDHGLSPTSVVGAKLTPCDASNLQQQFRILNDPADSLGVNQQWKHVLSLALQYATNHCVAYQGTDENSPCFVSTGTDPRTAVWSAAGSEAAASLGTLTSQSAGCGTTVATTLPSMHNEGTADLPVKLKSAGTSSHTVSIANTETVNASYSLTAGVKDLYSETGSFGFSWQHQHVTADAVSATRETEVDPILKSGEWLMATWSSQVLQFTGLWKLGVDTPTTSPGSLTWYMPATSILPAVLTSTGASPLTMTVLQSSTQKNCDAGPASVNTTAPTVAGDAGCTAAATARVGSTVYACPGNWNIPGVNPTPIYTYQWYTIAQGSNVPSPIPGATSASYSVPDQLLPVSPAVSYIGVIVKEIGPASRRESATAISQVTAQLLPRLQGSTEVAATNFVGWVPDASLGQQYSTSLVSNPGEGMTLSSDSSQLDGLSISADGVLSGTPTTPGDYPFEVTDTPTNDSPAQTVSLVLHVAGEPTAFASSTMLEATVGQPVSLDTVTSAADGLDLVLSGEIPAGLNFDPQSGLLSGTPTTADESMFTVSSVWSAQQFTVQVADTATVLHPDALPAGIVGTPYSAQTVSTVGSNAHIGLAVTPPEGGVDYSENAPVGQLNLTDLRGAGLVLNAETGAITGTPTRAGTITLDVANLADPDAAPVTKTIVITAAASDEVIPATTDHTALAKTGADAGSIAPIALVLLVVGIGLAMIRRRRLHG